MVVSFSATRYLFLVILCQVLTYECWNKIICYQEQCMGVTIGEVWGNPWWAGSGEFGQATLEDRGEFGEANPGFQVQGAAKGPSGGGVKGAPCIWKPGFVSPKLPLSPPPGLSAPNSPCPPHQGLTQTPCPQLTTHAFVTRHRWTFSKLFLKQCDFGVLFNFDGGGGPKHLF